MNQLELKIPPLMWLVVFLTLEYITARAFCYIPPETPYSGFAALIGFGALAIGVLAIVNFLKAQTTLNPMNPDQASSLVTSGIFQYSRNPMYLGLLLILIAWGIQLSCLLSLFIALLFIPCMNRLQIVPEEQHLESKFGEQYRDYQSKVRRWI